MFEILGGLQKAILVASLVHYGIAWFLWSDMGLGSILTSKSASKKVNPMDMVWYFVASLLSTAALAISIKVFHASAANLYSPEGFLQVFYWVLGSQSTENLMMASLRVATFIWLGFYVSQELCRCVSHRHPLEKCAVHMLAELLPLLGAAVTISYLL
jgi:hypothetical protein